MESTFLATNTAPCLFMDTASREPNVGVWQRGKWLAFHHSDSRHATESLFALIDSALNAAGGLKLHDLAGFIFTEGPGSILGIRVAAMALRTWRALPGFANKPIFAVGSLALAANLLLRAFPQQRNFSIFADSRQNWWNTSAVRDGNVPSGFEEMDNVRLHALPQPRYRIIQRPSAAPDVEFLPFPPNLLEQDPAVFQISGLLRKTDSPDAVNMPGQFTKWEPKRHGVPSANSRRT